MKNSLYIGAILFVVLLLVNGCEGLPGRPGAHPPVLAAPARPGPTSDLVFTVLAAELAGREGDHAQAFERYLAAARLGRDPRLAQWAVQQALHLKDDSRLREAVDLWLELAPDSVAALRIDAVLKARKGDRRAALKALRRVLALAQTGEGKENVYIEVVRLLSLVEDSRVRLDLMRALVGGAGDPPEGLYALAMLEASLRLYPAAEAHCRQVLAKRPQWQEARTLLVRVLGLEGKKKAARRELERALESAPDSRPLRTAYARLLLDLKDYRGARRQFARLLKGHPDDPDTRFALGVLALELKDLKAAQRHFEVLYRTDEKADQAAFYLGQIAELQGHEGEAADWFLKADGPVLFDARVRLADLYAKQGRLAEALETLHALATRIPERALDLVLVEGDLLRDAGHLKQALTLYDRALEGHPDNPDLLYARALTAVQLGRVDAMERDLRRILKAHPDHADALNALGYTLADQTDRLQEALGYIQRALALKPDSAAVLDSMGWVQYRLGRLHEALPYLRRAHAQDDDPEITAHLVEVLWKLDRHRQARRIWREAWKRHPKSTHLKRLRGLLGISRRGGGA